MRPNSTSSSTSSCVQRLSVQDHGPELSGKFMLEEVEFRKKLESKVAYQKDLGCKKAGISHVQRIERLSSGDW